MQKKANERVSQKTYTKQFDELKMAEKEFEILSWVCENGIYVPKAVSSLDKEKKGFSMKLIEGIEIDLNDKNLKNLLETCVEIHSLKVPGHIKKFLRTYCDEGKVYAKVLGLDGDFNNQIKYMNKISRSIVHNDLIKANIIENDKIAILDWGEAIYGIPQTDLVRTLYTFQKLNTPEEKDIVEFYKPIYLKSNPDKKEKFDSELKLARDYQFVKFAAGSLRLSEKEGISRENKAELERSAIDFLNLGGYKK